MKTLVTILFIIFLGTETQAQNNTTDAKVKTVEMTIVTETAYKLNIDTKNEVARLYKNKNYRVVKALSFTTKQNKAKMV